MSKDQSNRKGQSSSTTTTTTTTRANLKLNELNKNINLKLNGITPKDCEVVFKNNYNGSKYPEQFPKSNQFPLYFGTNEDEFNKNREITKRNRKLKRDVLLQRYTDDKNDKIEKSTKDLKIENYNEKVADAAKEDIPMSPEEIPNGTKLETKIETTNKEPKIEAKPEQKKPESKLKWSAIVEKSLPIVKKPKPTNIHKPITNSIEPLGIILLKIMYYDNFQSSIYKTCKPIIKPHGLINSGNICYMNSILQLLLFCEPFYNMLKIISNKSTLSINESNTPLLDALLGFFNEFNTKEESEFGKPLSPEGFYNEIIKHEKFSHLKWGQQEDAEEFLGYLLDGLHEEFLIKISKLTHAEISKLVEQSSEYETKLIKNCLTSIKKKSSENKEEISEFIDSDEENDGWLEVGNNKKVAAKRIVEVKPTPITNLFGGQFRSVLSIPKNKESQSITLDPFQHIQLDISDPKINSLEDAFKLLSEPEKITYTTSTNSIVLAKKQIFIDKLPNIFIIHLKRFSYTNNIEIRNESRIEKLKKFIKFNHSLTIPIECISPNKKNELMGNSFKLTGIIYHHGNSTSNGHYTCDVKTAKEWIRIDDTNIEKISEDKVLIDGKDENKTAYILMYQKV